jgi:hypothetical protein
MALCNAITPTKHRKKIFRVTNFQNYKDTKTQFFSPSFQLQTPPGYRMIFEVYAHGYGDGAGTHVSVFLNFLSGNRETHLEWPFNVSVTFTLLNQLGNDCHHSEVMMLDATDNIGVGRSSWGHHKFVKHSALDHNRVWNIQYLKDDTLYFRISVDVDDHNDYLHEC